MPAIDKFSLALVIAATISQPVCADAPAKKVGSIFSPRPGHQSIEQSLTLEEIQGWRQLANSTGSEKNKFRVICFSLAGGTRASLAVFRVADMTVAPALAQSAGGTRSVTATTADIAAEKKALLAVNGGYFNLSNGESTSYVVLAGKVCADPSLNKALTENPRLKPFLPQIYNRSELRFLKKVGSKANVATAVKITTHNEPLPEGMALVASLQAGPRLLPQLTAEDEAFVRTEADGRKVDSIGVGRTAARTAVGLTDDGYMLVLAVAGKGQDEFSSGLNLADLAKLLKKLGAVDAINFDGGTSTTMVKREKDHGPYETLIGRTPQTRVRSALTVGF